MIPGAKGLKAGATVKKYVGTPGGGLGKPIVDNVIPFTPRYKPQATPAGLAQKFADDAIMKKEQLMGVSGQIDSLFNRMVKETGQRGIDLKQHPKFKELQALEALKASLSKGK